MAVKTEIVPNSFAGFVCRGVFHYSRKMIAQNTKKSQIGDEGILPYSLTNEQADVAHSVFRASYFEKFC